VDPARHRGNATGIRAAFTGTHGIANGVNAILDAAAELQGRGDKHVRIELIGDGKLKPQLRERAVREGLANLIFVDPMPKAALAARLGELDVGLMVLANVPAFYYGTSPNKFFDYLACGLPVICNYPGWVSDLITEHDCGIAVPPDDPAAFADALQALASNMNQCERMGKNSVELAKRFDRETLANQFVDVLEFASH
jgi:glycosyltransferase involved in cell wall biosynthesis